MEKDVDKIMAFDTLFTNNRIQMYKILLSYLPPSYRHMLAVYIKFMELQYTMNFFQTHPQATLTALAPETPPDNNQLFDEIMPFCDMSQREQLKNMKNMMQNFENIREMMDMVQMMKELFPEGMGTQGADGFGGGMDMTQLFSMFGGNDMSGIF